MQTVDLTVTMAYMDNLDYDEKFEVKIEKYDCLIGSDFSEVTGIASFSINILSLLFTRQRERHHPGCLRSTWRK